MHQLSSNLEEEGVKKNIPYKDSIDQLFSRGNSKPDMESELLVSSMYFYYTKNVLDGLSPEESKATGWYLPRDRVDYVSYLDTLMKKPELIKKDKSEVFKNAVWHIPIWAKSKVAHFTAKYHSLIKLFTYYNPRYQYGIFISKII